MRVQAANSANSKTLLSSGADSDSRAHNDPSLATLATGNRMSLRNLALIGTFILALAWWYLREDPQTRVRNAHVALASAMSKTDADSGELSLLQVQGLRRLFAEFCVVSGDAGAQVGRFSPEEMVRNVIRLREFFDAVELTYTEPEIRFPADDEALAEFTVTVDASARTRGGQDVLETLTVRSEMRNIDGDWVFSGFHVSARE